MSLLAGELRVIDRLGLLDPKLMVDVGSCFGEHGILLRPKYPELRVLEFDPQNGTCALGAEDGELELSVFPYVPERSSGAKKYLEQLQADLVVHRKVPMFRLDSFFTEEIDFLKVDVEGMEMDVLLGLGDLRPSLVQFEFGFANTMAGLSLADFYRFFRPWGYEVLQLDWEGNYGNWLAAPPALLKKFF